MLTLVRDAEVFAPAPLGRCDVVVAAERILHVGPPSEAWTRLPDVIEVAAEGRYLVPGFIDQHVHILGGGGAAGFGSRGPEVTFSEAILAGTTTVIGCTGIDTIGRPLQALLAKARSLAFRGMSALIFTGGFDVPPVTLTGSVTRDLFLIPEIIGVGETAVSEFRSSHASIDELRRLVAQTVRGGLLAGKPGVIHVHLGDMASALDPLLEVVETTEVPIAHILPTHFNRSARLLEQARAWAQKGGLVDLTTAIAPPHYARAVKVSEAVKALVEAGVPSEQITFSTDGGGVSTLFGIDKVWRFELNALHRELQHLVLKEGVPLAVALPCVTSNVARALGLHRKGRIAPGADADLLLLDRDSLEIDTVITRGAVVARGGRMVSTQTLDV